jgi:putative transposase
MQLGVSLLFGLEYFGKVYGKTVIAVAPVYTSQDCSVCGNTVKKTLSTRTHICCCGAVLDRDHNAAKNILAKGLKQAGITLNTVGHTEINAWGQTDLYYEGGDINEQIDWPKQESSRLQAGECQQNHLEKQLKPTEYHTLKALVYLLQSHKQVRIELLASIGLIRFNLRVGGVAYKDF